MTAVAAFLLVFFAVESIQLPATADNRCLNAQNVCSCKRRSGIYTVGTVSGKFIEVYCDMEDGGYTFLNPTSLFHLTSRDLAFMFTNKKSFLFCYRRMDGTQFCAPLKQLPAYSNIPLKLGLNENSEYKPPVNLNVLGLPYLYFGFLPIAWASNRGVQGLSVNGNSLTFTNCDSNPNSYIALFPNYSGKTPSNYLVGTVWPLVNNIFANCVLIPARRYFPDYYFMFAEFHFGGCGAYSQTNRISEVVGVTIGFK